MAWKPFVNERSLAIQAFKQAIIDERGYLFRKFKESRLRQKTLWNKLKMGRLGLSSNYHEIVKKNLAVVYLGYASYLNPFELGGTELSGGWLRDQQRLNGEGFRDLSEHHFFAIEYVDASFLDAIAKNLGGEAELAALRIAAPAAARKVAAGGLDFLGISKGALLNKGVQPLYSIAEGVSDARERMHPKIDYTKAGYGSQQLIERVGGPQGASLKSLAPRNQPALGPGESGGLRMGLTDNYGPRGVNILEWQLLCVRQTTIVNISKSPIACSGLSSILAGSIEWETVASVVSSWDGLKRHPPRIFARGGRRSYWRESGKSDLAYYDSTQGGEFEKILQSKFVDWIPYGAEGPRRAVINALPDLPEGVGPIADLDLEHE